MIVIKVTIYPPIASNPRRYLKRALSSILDSRHFFPFQRNDGDSCDGHVLPFDRDEGTNLTAPLLKQPPITGQLVVIYTSLHLLLLGVTFSVTT